MAWRSTSTAIAGTQPNLRDSGHSAPSPSVSTRQKTRAPGAARAIFSTSSTQSTANRRMPSSKARAMSRSFLMVLPKEMRSAGRTGIQRHLDFGNGRGVEGRAHRGKQAQDLRRRVCFHRVVNPGIRQRLLEGAEIVAHDVEVDDEARAVRDVGWQGNRGYAGWPSVSPIARRYAARSKAAARRSRPRRSRGGQRRDGYSMEPAGGDPGTMKRASRGDEPWPCPARIRFVCLGLDGRPVRTAGNEGVPLQ